MRFAVGYLTGEQRASTRTVLVRRPGLQTPRQRNANWCPGRYAGYVEYRQPDRTPGIPFERLGALGFVVEP